MTIKEVLQETAMIEMSLDNLGLYYNESIMVKIVSAVVRTLQRFVTWIAETLIPFIQRIIKAIEKLLRKTKLGRKIFAKKGKKMSVAQRKNSFPTTGKQSAYSWAENRLSAKPL